MEHSRSRRSNGGRRGAWAWLAAASASVGFFAFSIAAVVTEGPTGFWPEHTQHLWGNQIWFDLLLAMSIAWVFMAREARALQMRTLAWFAFVVATGSVGAMAMLARILYLKDQRA